MATWSRWLERIAFQIDHRENNKNTATTREIVVNTSESLFSEPRHDLAVAIHGK